MPTKLPPGMGGPLPPGPAAPPAPVIPALTGTVEFSYNPQDQVTMQPSTLALDVKAGPSTDKVKLGGPQLEARDGKFVFETKDARYHRSNAFVAAARTVKIFSEASGIDISWAFNQPQLKVNADNGTMLNAFYSRHSGGVNFFHADDPVSKKTVYTGDSGEVVSHETGHAILDAIRPSYLGAWAPDAAAFHESFGDVLAMLVTLQDDHALDKVMEQTGGDLTKHNVASDLGEELGVVVNHKAGKNATGGDWTRTAIHDFKWADPKTLPEKGGPTELGREAHSFSRLWTGGFYDVLQGLVAQNREAGMDARASIREASNEGLKMLGQLFKTAPQGEFTFQTMAESCLKADRDYNQGKHGELLTSVFKNRQILPSEWNASALGAPEGTRGALSLQQQSGPAELTKELVPLNGSGKFAGAVVEMLVDPNSASLDGDNGADEVRSTVQQLIDEGRVLYTEPGQQLTDADLFDAHGRPYMGVVSWLDGQMKIERSPIAA